MPLSKEADTLRKREERKRGKHPKPNSRAPDGCFWDGDVEPEGAWRFRDTNEIWRREDPPRHGLSCSAR